MLQILALIILVCISADISRRVYVNRAVFEQLSQPTSIAWLVWLYPLPFLLPLFAKSFFALVLFRVPLGVLFFLPALMSAKSTRKCFEISGNGRVKPALATLDLTVTSGIMGIMGVLILTFLVWIFGWGKT